MSGCKFVDGGMIEHFAALHTIVVKDNVTVEAVVRREDQKMLPHPIRLRGPWLIEAHTQTRMQAVLPATPAELGLASALGGSWQLTRRFGLPRTLDAHESVWLCAQGIQRLLGLKLNEQVYDVRADDVIEIELGHSLKVRNELIITISPTAPQTPVFRSVELVIRGRAFLRQLQAERQGQCVRVSGQVVGPTKKHLEVYVIAQRHTVAHLPVSAEPDGWALSLMTDPIPDGVDWVQVELVCVTSVWHSQEVLIRS